jgi:hypothetical protein
VNAYRSVAAAVVLILLPLGAHPLIEATLVGRRHEEKAGLEKQRAELRTSGTLARELSTLAPPLEVRDREKLALWATAQKSFLTDANDRLWVVDLHERMRRGFGDLSIRLDQTSRSTPLPVRLPAEVAEELTSLGRVQARLPNADPSSAGPPSEIGGWTLEARFQVTGPYDSVAAFVRAIQAEPLHLEITRVDCTYERPTARGDQRLTAAVTVCALAFEDPARTIGR